MFRYNLLCDGCNWEFKGFAVPGTVSPKPNGRRKSDGKAKRQNGESSAEESYDGGERRSEKRAA